MPKGGQLARDVERSKEATPARFKSAKKFSKHFLVCAKGHEISTRKEGAARRRDEMGIGKG